MCDTGQFIFGFENRYMEDSIFGNIDGDDCDSSGLNHIKFSCKNPISTGSISNK